MISSNRDVDAGTITTSGNLTVRTTGNTTVAVFSSTGGNITGNIVASGYANIGGNLIAGNIDGGNAVVANYFVGSGANLSSIAGGNVTGTVANANYSSYSNVATTSNGVAFSNISGMIVPVAEYHVSKNGNDTTGTGASLNPYASIGKAVSVAAAGDKIIVHPGGYTENVEIANLSTITISSVDSAGGGPFSPAIYGNLTVSGNSTAIAIKGIGVQGVFTHSSSGSLYITGSQLGGAGVAGTFNKTGTGFLSVVDSNWSLISGANLTAVSITASGTALFSNVAFANLTIDNATASVTVTSGSTTLLTTLNTGTLNVFDSFMYTLGNSGYYALSSNGGTVSLRNSTLVNPNLSAAKINLSAGTILSYGDVFFDRANSNLGIQAGTTVDFQALRIANGISSATLTATGNANVGNIGAAAGVFTTVSGNGSALTSLTGANVTGTVANATYATTAGTVTTAAQSNITSVGTLTSLDVSGNLSAANITSTTGLTVGGQNWDTAWTTYTPTWTGASSNPSLGNGTITGRYKQLGETVFFQLKLSIGSTTTGGSGSWRFGLPVAAYGPDAVIASMTCLDNGVSWYNGQAFTAYDGNTSYVVGFVGSQSVSPTTPFTWGNSDTLTITGSYEAA